MRLTETPRTAYVRAAMAEGRRAQGGEEGRAMTTLHLTTPTMRHRSEASRPCVRTSADLLIGAAYLTPRPPHYARAASGPHRAPDTLGDKAVKWASAIGALVVAGLLVLERLS